MKIKIKHRHFKNARKYADSRNCPLARSLQEKYEHKIPIFIDTYTAHIGLHDKQRGYTISKEWSNLTGFEIDTMIANAQAGIKQKTIKLTLKKLKK